jgi:hypothetical protein
MKPWQHGYELDYLVKIQEKYAEYNSYCLGPFAEIKKNKIADSLNKGTMLCLAREYLEVNTSKVTTKIVMHGDTLIGVKERGDVTLSRITSYTDYIAEYVNILSHENCWLYVWAEDPEATKFATDNGFDYVNSKITTYGEIYAIYFRNSKTAPTKRVHPSPLPEENCNIEQCTGFEIDSARIWDELTDLDPELKYTDHYSNYNAKGSWSAISLRGYSDDPAFIAKPIEMNKKWKAKNEHWESWGLRDTELLPHFPYLESIIDSIPTERVHRIRFMKLAAGGGELQRHTDQVDPDSGIRDGKVMRLHIPVVTNEGVWFSSWRTDGTESKIHMPVGTMWYIDTRKPHRAINGGTEDRIHAVIDVEANDECRKLLVPCA